MITDAFNSHVDPVMNEMTGTQQILISHVYDSDERNSKGCLVYVPHTRKIISSYDVVFDESLYSVLAYTSQPYSEAMAMR